MDIVDLLLQSKAGDEKAFALLFSDQMFRNNCRRYYWKLVARFRKRPSFNEDDAYTHCYLVLHRRLTKLNLVNNADSLLSYCYIEIKWLFYKDLVKVSRFIQEPIDNYQDRFVDEEVQERPYKKILYEEILSSLGRAGKVYRAFLEGEHPQDIANKLGIKRATVYRDLKEAGLAIKLINTV